MENANPAMNKTKEHSSEEKMNAKIKEMWGKLSDEDVKLSVTNKSQFFAKVEEKQNVSRQDAEKKLQEIEKSCGCGTSKAA